MHVDRTTSTFLSQAYMEVGPFGETGIACRMNFYLYLAGTGKSRKKTVVSKTICYFKAFKCVLGYKHDVLCTVLTAM